MNLFVERMKSAMKELKVTPETLSEKTDIHVKLIKMYIRGTIIPTPDKLESIADALCVTVDWLCGSWEETQNDKKNRLSVPRAAELMGVSSQFIRIGLQRNTLPFGYAVKNGNRWTYYISPLKFTESTGIPTN